MFVIEEELKKLPAKPGVYIMHDEHDNIIYVGKAISLKNRVRQYFQSSRNHTEKIKQMVSHVSYFEYIITDSELEALVLECNLIKEHRPKYNTMLKDDKTYPYIKVTVYEDFPRVLFSRDMKKDKSKYFGPYTSATAVKDTIELLRKIYKIRTCSRCLPRDIGKDRPCLNYHIKQCAAPCQGYISKEEYCENINKTLEFLNGNYSGVISSLKDKMEEAAGKLEFEEAAGYRDLLASVQAVAQKQKITNSDMKDKDVIAAAIEGNTCVIQAFFIREGRLIGRDKYNMELAATDTRQEVITDFIKQFYGGMPFVPRQIMVQEELPEAAILEEWLTKKRGSRVEIVAPKKGQKEKLVELAQKNAEMVLAQDIDKLQREKRRTTGAVKEIEELLGIESAYRMEAYDISNISGAQSVGSMVVYQDGRPKRNDYRKFRIKTVVGPNDYASMEEVLTRRFTHEGDASFDVVPDLIMMDGGRGQVNVCLGVLEKLGLDIKVCGMVKDDNHRTRGLYYNNVEIPISRDSEAFRLITRIQDEAHRFAIEYHRNLRSANQVRSVLDDIEGIGPARRKALLHHFKDVEHIKEATQEELATVDGMNAKAAASVYAFFHKQ
ncbi:MAG: excinuclease ABC subunit UvrC [Lachnospiraceae bacterium]